MAKPSCGLLPMWQHNKIEKKKKNIGLRGSDLVLAWFGWIG
jgi:hypothetical protein